MWSIQRKNKNKKNLLYFGLVFSCFLPLLSSAQIQITEIMYDLVGGDTGKEWIEVYNSGSTSVDLSEWFLFENETNHRISSVIEDGNSIIEVGAYAVLVDNPEKFYEDWPNFSGLVLDSAFSLKNIDELLVIKNPDKEETDSIHYYADWGANGDGNSLQKINGDWKATLPTLGKANFVSENSNQNQEIIQEEAEEETSSGTNNSPPVIPIEINIKANILDLDYLPVAGADFTLRAIATGLKGEPLQNEKYQWTLGDGSKKEGQNILHRYSYPGEYMVVLEVISGEHSTCAKKKIKVIAPDIIISKIGKSLNDNFIELYNPSNYELDLSWWRLQVDGNFFTLPKNTILLPKNYLKLPFDVTKLLPQKNSLIRLLFPNGMTVSSYEEKQEVTAPVKMVVKPVQAQAQKQEEPLYFSVEKEDVEEKELIKEDSVFTASVQGADFSKENKKESNSFFLFDKWFLFLVLVVVLAGGGVVYASKLDSDSEIEAENQ